MASMHDNARSKTTVYAAIELSKKRWVVAIARPDRDRPSIHRIAGGNLAALIGRLRKAAGEKQRIVVCDEVGYDGFWLARSLAKIGIDCRGPRSGKHPSQSTGAPSEDRSHRFARPAAGSHRDRPWRAPRPATAGHDASLSKSHGSGGNTNPAVACLSGTPARPRINRRGSGASC